MGKKMSERGAFFIVSSPKTQKIEHGKKKKKKPQKKKKKKKKK
jgi:hypothetical protein